MFIVARLGTRMYVTIFSGTMTACRMNLKCFSYPQLLGDSMMDKCYSSMNIYPKISMEILEEFFVGKGFKIPFCGKILHGDYHTPWAWKIVWASKQ